MLRQRSTTAPGGVTGADRDGTAAPRPGRGRRLLHGARQMSPVIICAFALAFVVFWYTPAYLYSSNLRQFFFPLLQVLPVLAIPLVGTVIVLVLPAFAMRGRVRRFYAAVLASLAAFAFVQGFVLRRDYGLLDGAVDLPSFSWLRLMVSIVAVVAVASLVTFGPLRPSLLLGAFVAVGVVLFVHVVVLVIADPKPVRAVEPSKVDSLYEMGRENLLVILLDALQSDVFAQVIEERPELGEALDGFTYYPETMGVGRTTYVSLPTIHSSDLREPGTSMNEHFDESIGQNSFLTELADQGWKTMLLNPTGGVCPARIERCLPYDASKRTSSRVRLLQQSAELVDVSLFRVAPPELKAKVYNSNQWRLRPVFRGVSYMEAGDIALRDLTENVHRAHDGKSAKFLHLQSTHSPATRHEDCTLLDRPVRITWPTARDQATCALTRVSALIDKLKRQDLYENTSIVILADTGYGKLGSSRVDDERWKKLIGNANPTLAVKPAGASGPLRTSGDHLSLMDLGPIICSLTKHCGDVPDWRSPDPQRPRPFLMYEWHDEFWHATTLLNEQYFEVRGSFFDPESWKEVDVGVDVPNVSTLTFGEADAAGHFGHGWGPVVEHDGEGSRWALGEGVSLSLRIDDDADYRVELDVGALAEHPNQAVVVNVNGRRLRRLPVSGSDQTVWFRVPSELARRDVDIIRMRFDYYRSGGSEPDRHKRRLESLAVRFDELRVVRHGR